MGYAPRPDAKTRESHLLPQPQTLPHSEDQRHWELWSLWSRRGCTFQPLPSSIAFILLRIPKGVINLLPELVVNGIIGSKPSTRLSNAFISRASIVPGLEPAVQRELAQWSIIGQPDKGGVEFSCDWQTIVTAAPYLTTIASLNLQLVREREFCSSVRATHCSGLSGATKVLASRNVY